MKDHGCVIIRILITWGKTAENFLCEKSINALSRSFVSLRINIIYILCPAAWESYPEGINEKKKWSSNPQNKSVHSGYRYKAIVMMNIKMFKAFTKASFKRKQ